MNFQQAIQSGFSNYANFRSRAARSEFWYWQLFVLAGGIAAEFLDLVFGYSLFDVDGPLITLFWLATLIPNLAVMVGRLHDTDRLVASALLDSADRIDRADRMVVHARLDRLQPLRLRSAAAGH